MIRHGELMQSFTGTAIIKAVLLLYSNRSVDTFPAVINTAAVLADYGIFVEILVNESVSVIDELPYACTIISGNSRADYIRNVAMRFSGEGDSGVIFIAYTIEGLLATTLINKHRLVPVLYMSLELVYGNYLRNKYINLEFFNNFLGGAIKALWKPGYRQWVTSAFKELVVEIPLVLKLYKDGSSFVVGGVIQDSERDRILTSEFPFIGRTAIVPNSYIECNHTRTDYAHLIFNIPLNKKIILYCGGVERGFPYEIFAAIESLSDEFVLVVNAYSRDSYLEYIRQRLSFLEESGRVFFTSGMLQEREYDSLVGSAYIGLVWYPQCDKSNYNMYYIGLSSGKLCKCLSRGKPVIVQGFFHGYRELVETNHLGRAVSSPSELAKAVLDIDMEYESYDATIGFFCRDQLDFTKKFTGAINELIPELLQRKETA